MIAPPMPCRPAGGDQRARVRRQPPGQRGEREQHQPDQVELRRPYRSASEPGAEHQRGQRQRVDVDHPLELAERRPQIGRDVGQRDVHDRDVDQEHEGAGADRDQREPFAHRSAVPLLDRVAIAPARQSRAERVGLGRHARACRHGRRGRPMRVRPAGRHARQATVGSAVVSALDLLLVAAGVAFLAGVHQLDRRRRLADPLPHPGRAGPGHGAANVTNSVAQWPGYVGGVARLPRRVRRAARPADPLRRRRRRWAGRRAACCC